jgi:hypothetical protein
MTPTYTLSSQDVIYWECHVTISPVLDQVGLDLLNSISTSYGFKLAKLVMIKGGDESLSTKDSFMTSHAPSDKLDDLKNRMQLLCQQLESNSFQVWRFKIEGIVLDTKY